MKSDSSVVTTDFFGAHTANAATQGKSMAWTDEKHNLYLDLLETSFVEQLNCSRSLCSSLLQEKTWSSYSFQCGLDLYDTGEQFMVLQDGYEQKMNTESIERPLDSTADSEDVLGSPWIHPFAPAGKCFCSKSSKSLGTLAQSDEMCPRNMTNFSFNNNMVFKEECHFCDHSFNGGTSCKNITNSLYCIFSHSLSLFDIRVACIFTSRHQLAQAFNCIIDYYFIDVSGEEDQEEKVKEKRRPEQRGQGSKLDLVDNTSLDQVVPSGKPSPVDDSSNVATCLKRGKKRLLSGCPGRFAAPKKLDVL